MVACSLLFFLSIFFIFGSIIKSGKIPYAWADVYMYMCGLCYINYDYHYLCVAHATLFPSSHNFFSTSKPREKEKETSFSVVNSIQFSECETSLNPKYPMCICARRRRERGISIFMWWLLLLLLVVYIHTLECHIRL